MKRVLLIGPPGTPERSFTVPDTTRIVLGINHNAWHLYTIHHNCMEEPEEIDPEQYRYLAVFDAQDNVVVSQAIHPLPLL